MRDLLLLFDGFHIEGGLGSAAFYAAFGLLFVFVGIVLLVAIFTLIGLIMKKTNARKKAGAEKDVPKAAEVPSAEKGIPPEVIAAITAAVAAYTAGEKAQCDFVVRRIKRL